MTAACGTKSAHSWIFRSLPCTTKPRGFLYRAWPPLWCCSELSISCGSGRWRGNSTRIAREFHDTLLQSFQGVLMKFHAVTYLLPDSHNDARKMLESVIEQARHA